MGWALCRSRGRGAPHANHSEERPPRANGTAAKTNALAPSRERELIQATAQLKKYLRSGLIRYRPEEAGFKDTVNANPHQITVVRAKYSLPSTALKADGTVAGGVQRYVHHCHIVEHEDNDMMERFAVVDHAPPPPQ